MAKDKLDKETINMGWYDNTERMKLSESYDVDSDFVDLLTTFEGVRYEAYLDPVGIKTIGVGFTEGVKLGDTMTQQEVEERLEQEVQRFEQAIDKYVKVPLTQYQFNALVSFVYNVGVGSFRDSTLLKKLNNKDYVGCADEFLRWNKAGGKVLKGLTRRRKAEREMFLGNNWKEVV